MGKKLYVYLFLKVYSIACLDLSSGFYSRGTLHIDGLLLGLGSWSSTRFEIIHGHVNENKNVFYTFDYA